jgi:hypothetical protein
MTCIYCNYLIIEEPNKPYHECPACQRLFYCNNNEFLYSVR